MNDNKIHLFILDIEDEYKWILYINNIKKILMYPKDDIEDDYIIEDTDKSFTDLLFEAQAYIQNNQSLNTYDITNYLILNKNEISLIESKDNLNNVLIMELLDQKITKILKKYE